MLIKQSDQKNTLALIGGFLAYHNLLRHDIDNKFGNIKKILNEFDTDLKNFRDIRNKLAHEIREIINSNIISVNSWMPNWNTSNEELKSYIVELLNLRNRILLYN